MKRFLDTEDASFKSRLLLLMSFLKGLFAFLLAALPGARCWGGAGNSNDPEWSTEVKTSLLPKFSVLRPVDTFLKRRLPRLKSFLKGLFGLALGTLSVAAA